MLAAKSALAIRVDALGEETNTELGLEHKAKLERRLRQLEEGKVRQGIWKWKGEEVKLTLAIRVSAL